MTLIAVTLSAATAPNPAHPARGTRPAPAATDRCVDRTTPPTADPASRRPAASHPRRLAGSAAHGRLRVRAVTPLVQRNPETEVPRKPLMAFWVPHRMAVP